MVEYLVVVSPYSTAMLLLMIAPSFQNPMPLSLLRPTPLRLPPRGPVLTLLVVKITNSRPSFSQPIFLCNAGSDQSIPATLSTIPCP
jgi:hypothetical protein